MSIGYRIKKLRKKKNITQLDLANKLFVTDKTISSWESNRTEPGLELLVKLSDLLDCSVGYLIYGDNPKSVVETEIKFKITKTLFDQLISKMDKESKFLKENRQLDTYYQPTYRKFLNDNEITEWLRIGERGNKTIINYKNWHDNMYCDEYEVEIDNSKNLDRIFNVLGLEKIVVVDKQRKTYYYLDKYEIAFDYVKELGYFIEIEVKNYSKDPIEEYSDLLNLAKDLNLSFDNIDKRGYPYHLIFGI